MAGKSSKLAQGVNRTGNGLFRGMTAINSAKAEEKEASKKTNDISKSEEASDSQDVRKVENTDALTETANNSDEKISAQFSENMQDNLHNEEIAVHDAASKELNEAAAAPKKAANGATEPQNIVASTATEPAKSYEPESAADPIPEIVEEPMPEPASEPSESVHRSATGTASQPVLESSGRRIRAADVKDMQDTAESASSKGKSSSRYEKEKFLLLDIRGYRDYVEHMAKAANMSATKYIRNLIQQDMDMNMDIYEAHKALEEKLKGRVTR